MSQFSVFSFVLAAAIILTSQALVLPGSGFEGSSTVRYALDASTSLPQYYTGIDFGTLKSDTIWDDVIFFADSKDCNDNRVDGVKNFNYGEFDACRSMPVSSQRR